jgi:hypothetical protein
MNTGEQLTANFKAGEFLRSETAAKMGIDTSNPPPDVEKNIRERAAPKAQEALDILGVKCTIHCWRPDAVNAAIPGRPPGKRGAHPDGLAIDLVAEGMTPQEVFDKLKAHPDYMRDVDQLIIERGCVHTGLACPASGWMYRRELRTETMDGQGMRHYPLLGIWQPPA